MRIVLLNSKATQRVNRDCDSAFGGGNAHGNAVSQYGVATTGADLVVEGIAAT